MAKSAIIAGGSIAGLFAAAALAGAGWRVDVFERSGVELAGRGAGIVTHDALLAALKSVGASLDALGVEVEDRVAFDANGERLASLHRPQIVTSWDRIHSGLRRLVPTERHHLGRRVTGYRDEADGVSVSFEDGDRARADVLVGADGFRSAVRAELLPDVVPVYAGYVVWRALAREADLAADVRAKIFDAFGFYAPSGMQIIGYPIAGEDNDLRPGHRRYNFVWYVKVPEPVLADMLTDASGRRHSVSIPPPLVRSDVLARMEAEARAHLPPPFVEVLEVSERPFFTPIYDHLSPQMAAGSVALVGDAACVARPHVGMGVTKAAGDALALARWLAAEPVDAGLAGYSAERLEVARLAHQRAQRLGRHIFDSGTFAANANDKLAEIMRITAADVSTEAILA